MEKKEIKHEGLTQQVNLDSKQVDRDDDFRAQFRRPTNAQFLHEIPKSWIDPTWMVKLVAVSYRRDPFHMQRALDEGWDFIRRPGDETKGYSNLPSDKGNLRNEVIRVVTSDGAEMYWMFIPKDKYQEKTHKKTLQRKADVRRSVNASKSKDGIREVDRDVYEYNPTRSNE